jgi:hypothetical protein
LLHDLNIHTGESLIAYQLLRPQLRCRGFGTLTLRLLQSSVMQETGLNQKQKIKAPFVHKNEDSAPVLSVR